MFLLFVIILINILSIESDGRRGLINKIRIKPTVGEVWPKPQSIETTNEQYSIHPSTFHFVLNEKSQQCDLLTNAFIRYYKIIFYPHTYLSSILSKTNDFIRQPQLDKFLIKNLSNNTDIPLLKDVYVNVQTPCDEWPRLESNESCNLFYFVL